MARFYDVAVAALACDAPTRWVDNCLTAGCIGSVVPAGRGRSRRIPHAAVLQLAATRILQESVGASVREASALAARLLDSEDGRVPIGGQGGPIVLTLDRAALGRLVDDRLRLALETAPAPRRGRPPKKRRGGPEGPPPH